MKAENAKLLFVYGNITFIVVAGFFILYQLATRQDIGDAAAQAIGAASIFSGFVGMAIQFLTGSEIATRANRAATANFTTGLAAPTATVTPTVTVSSGGSTSTTTGAVGPPEGEG